MNSVIFQLLCMLQLLSRARTGLRRLPSTKYSNGYNDPDGFDPYADTVGAGIYGGNVKRGKDGKVIIGKQYRATIRIQDQFMTGPGTL